MNKRFFTLMAAVLLAGAPLCNEAFAGDKEVVALNENATMQDLANGLKFVVSFNGGYLKVLDVEDTNYVSKISSTYPTDIAEASVFEVRNYSGGTFQLWVDGKQFVVKKSDGQGYVVDDDKDIAKVFVAKNSNGTTTKTNFTSFYTYVVGDAGKKIWSADLTANTIKETLTAVDLNEINTSSTSFSFGASEVEGNIFSELTPIQLGATSPFVVGTYFVKGAAKDITAFTNNPNKDNAKKLTFAAVTTEAWGLNTKAAGEGYKLAMVNGEAFYGDNALAGKNAAFTVVEADQLNNEGELVLTAKVKVSSTVTDQEVKIAAVKASSSDAKTYVTTVNTSASQFASITNPSLGANTYFAASEFLKEDEVSAYNVFFTSGKAVSAGQQPYEYGRYLSVVSDGTSYALHATSPDSTNVHAPLSQWIVTDFNGKYDLTLKSREGEQTLTMKLESTGVAGEYKIVGGAAAAFEIVNIVDEDADGNSIDELNKKTIKLIPTTLSKNDGYLVLSEEDMSGTIALTFTGKSALAGEQTYYLKLNDAKNAFIPTLKASDAVAVNVALNDASDAAKIENAFAYLDAKGNVMTDGVDSLYVPNYALTYKVGDDTYYVKNTSLQVSTTKTDAGKAIFKSHISGNYALHVETGNPSKVADADAVATKVNGTTFANGAKVNALKDDDFAYVTLYTEDQNDYATLEAVARHATFENVRGAVSFEVNKNGILEGILSAAPMTFWLDTADSEKATPAFYISKGIAAAEDEVPATKADEAVTMRNFLFNPADSAVIYNEGSATVSTDKKYILEGSNNLKAIFRPAALIAEDTLATVVDGKDAIVVAKDANAAKGQVNGLKSFQFGITLADEDVEGEYVIKSKADGQYLYSLNGRLGFTANAKEAYVFTLGEGDATANEAIAAEGVQVIAGNGTITVQGAAGKVVTVANILGQTIANQVAASDNVTIAVPAGIVVVAVDGEATKVVVK